MKTLYQLHPEFRDVIVEGRDDARLVRWYLGHYPAQNVRVYAIDDRVEVPSNLVRGIGHEVNVRGRVLALATEVHSWDSHEAFTSIVDRDFDELLGALPSLDCLLITDYSSMEIYSLSPNPMTKFVALHTTTTLSVEEYIDRISDVLHTVFCVRFALKAKDIPLVGSFDACVVDDGQVLGVDPSELIRRSAPQFRNDWAELRDSAEAAMSDNSVERLKLVRGHDIAPILRRHGHLRRRNVGDDIIEDLLRSCVAVDDLDSTTLFSSLLARVS